MRSPVVSIVRIYTTRCQPLLDFTPLTRPKAQWVAAQYVTGVTKVKDSVSAAKAKTKVAQAKAEEKAETATARSHAERELAHERGKAKVAAAKMELRQDKALHREEAIEHRLHKHGHGVAGGYGHHNKAWGGCRAGAAAGCGGVLPSRRRHWPLLSTMRSVCVRTR
jgi:hypothetical protein